MEETRPTRATFDETLKRVHDTRNLVRNVQIFVAATRCFYRENLAIFKHALATTRRLHEQIAQSRFAERRCAPPQSARRLRLLIAARIDAGRLPDTESRTVLVSGFGGECEACDQYMPSTELVIAIPKGGTFVYLHADCASIWKAQCCLRVALQEIAQSSAEI